MLKVVLINSSPLKLKIVTEAFTRFFPNSVFEFIESEILNFKSDTISREECLKLMRQKISDAKESMPDASYYVFMRGRMEDRGSIMEEFALVLIQNKNGIEGISDAASFEVPEEIAQLVREGVSFSDAVEKVYDQTGIKNGSGFVGILTNKVVMKEDQYFQPTAIALATCFRKSNLQ